MGRCVDVIVLASSPIFVSLIRTNFDGVSSGDGVERWNIGPKAKQAKIEKCTPAKSWFISPAFCFPARHGRTRRPRWPWP